MHLTRSLSTYAVTLIGLAVLSSLGVASVALAEESGTALRLDAVSERVASDTHAGEEAFARGEVVSGCKAVLECLRALDPDRPELLDLTTDPLHLLILGMCLLMDDADLEDFLSRSLAPDTYPIDDAVLLYFHVQYKSFSDSRKVPAAPLLESVQRAQRMADGQHGLVRALGLSALSWYAPDGTVGESARTAFNSLAEICPDARSTREVLHRLLLVSVTADRARSLGVRDILDRTDWNSAVQAIIADDPVVALLRDVASRPAQEGQGDTMGTAAAVLEAAKDAPDGLTRSWALRLASATSENDLGENLSFSTSVRAQCEAMALRGTATGKSLQVAEGDAQPLDALRARHILFSQALLAKDTASAGVYLDALLTGRSNEEPLDSNSRLVILLDAVEYGFTLIKAGDYPNALITFERIAKKYPNSHIGERCQMHVEHIKSVQKLSNP